jgi:secondary thiamine-phosphate synthase enzyme
MTTLLDVCLIRQALSGIGYRNVGSAPAPALCQTTGCLRSHSNARKLAPATARHPQAHDRDGFLFSQAFVKARMLFHLREIMKAHTSQFDVSTRGKGTYEITDQVADAVRESGASEGVATVFIQHTSASLIIYENADHTARTDLEAWFDRLVPEDEDYFVHTLEGSDDMPGHIRMVLTRTSETVPVHRGRLQLGTWQGIFLFEHRRSPHRRSIVVSVVGA